MDKLDELISKNPHLTKEEVILLAKKLQELVERGIIESY